MKNINFLSLLIVTILIFNIKFSDAQTPTFKLSDYKNPDYLYQTLDLNFGLNSGFINNHSSSAGVNPQYTASSFTLNSGAGANYSRYKNSLKTQQEQHISFNAGIGSSSYQNKSGNPEQENKSNNFSHAEAINISALSRFFNEKQQYFEANGSIYGRYDGLSQGSKTTVSGTIMSETGGNQKDLNLNMAGSLRVGKGRIEQVQDARLAMYILEDLQKLKRAKKIATDEDVLALAQEITLLKYKRFFDYRLRKIAEITAIDAFLHKSSIAGMADAAYFTSLNDNWDFANNPIRNSGKRFYAGLDASYGYNYLTNLDKYIVPVGDDSKYNYNKSNAGLFIVAGIDCEKPENLTWQKSSSIQLGVGVQSQVENEKALENTDETTYYLRALPSAKLSADYGFGYYPNSRTWLTLNWWLLSGWDKEMDGATKSEKEKLQNSFYTYTGPQFNAYYYLSEKLRLSLTFNGEFRFENKNYTYDVIPGNPEKVTTTWWNQQVNASLTYSLF
jgi:hypothetical protein